jgi:hypothetical protein
MIVVVRADCERLDGVFEVPLLGDYGVERMSFEKTYSLQGVGADRGSHQTV